MKTLYLLLLTALCSMGTLQAQYVTIPDSAFRVYLQANFAACMNGNQLDTTCPAINRSGLYLNLNGKGIRDLTGAQYFDSLYTINATDNFLTFLPPLPVTLAALNVSRNQLTSLPALPRGLIQLTVSYNQLTSLPALPDSLYVISCANNSITTLPALPVMLYSLNCRNNSLTSLPALPQFMNSLSADGNGITSLPALPPALDILYIDGSPIGSLPALPATLTLLTCNTCQLTSLPAPLPPGLKTLQCNSNAISSLPALPATLTYLACSNTGISSIPTLPDTLTWLECLSTPSMHCLPRLTRIGNLYFDGANITCLPNYGVVNVSVPDINLFPLCTPGNAAGCQSFWNIGGTVYNDSTGNCQQNAGETNVSNLKVNLRQGGTVVQQTYTGGYGQYSFESSAGSYSFEVDTTGAPFSVTCPAAGFDTATITAANSMQTHNFGLQCKPGFDIAVEAIASYSVFRPAAFNTINVKAGDAARFYNQSCNTIGLGGQLVTTISGPLHYVSAAPGALTPAATGTTLTYTIADWSAINPQTAFNIITQTDTTAQSGATACFTVSATPTAGDNNTGNNTYSFCFPVVASYDPNDKAVYPSGAIDENGSRWLTYTVRFQNTGTAPAENIFITDTLDSDLEVETFQLLSYSFQPSVLIKGKAVKFVFSNINLPDSVNDEPNSHGYVQYKVKIKGNAGVGTVVTNTAFIYFDFNAPVVTNTTTNTLGQPNGITALGSSIGTMQVYPNPAQNVVMVNLSDNLTGGSLTLTDVTGRILNTMPVTAMHNELNTAALSSGVYLLTAIKGGEKVVQRLVVSK